MVPLVAMMREHSRSGSTAPMQLLYSLRSAEDAFFRDELREFGSTMWHYTRSAPPDWPGPVGRVTADDLRRETLPAEREPLIYVCGPTGFVEAVAAALIELGHSTDNIRTERFGGA